jgi:hypothetical protein
MEANAERAKLEQEEAMRAKAKRDEEREEERAAINKTFAPEVARGTFAFHSIRIYQNGFVRIKKPFGGTSFERLIGIDASSDVARKSGLGRGVGAVATMGLSLAKSNKKGDVYLAITTNVKTHLLHADPPTAMNLNTLKRLEAAGNAVIRARDGQLAPPVTEQTTAEKLRDLEKLRADGLVSADEYDELRAKLLGDL